MASMFDRNIRGQEQSIHVQYCVILGGSPERVPGGGIAFTPCNIAYHVP